MRVVSYGGGVQSTALLALAAQDKIPHRTFLFANTGDDSEHPDTLHYVREVAMPFAAEHGIEMVELQYRRRDGTPVDLRSHMMREDRKSIPIPMYGESGAPLRRGCTSEFKIRVIAKEIRKRGATAENPARMALGISVDEIQRAKAAIDPRTPEQLKEYPLLELGMHRNPDCRDAIEAVGLPIPPKSACYFCPFHDREAWRSLKRERPDLFQKAAELEDFVRSQRAADGGRDVWLTRSRIPLVDAVDDQSQLFPEGDDCDSGHCFT